MTQTSAESITSKMANALTSVDELLAESVRLYPVLYNKGDKFFKDVNKKTLAWEDVAKKTGFPSGNYQIRMLVWLLF